MFRHVLFASFVASPSQTQRILFISSINPKPPIALYSNQHQQTPKRAHQSSENSPNSQPFCSNTSMPNSILHKSSKIPKFPLRNTMPLSRILNSGQYPGEQNAQIGQHKKKKKRKITKKRGNPIDKSIEFEYSTCNNFTKKQPLC